MKPSVLFTLWLPRTPVMDICSFQTGDQDFPHCVGPPLSSQIPPALNERQQRY